MMRIGTAGWSIPTEFQKQFPQGKTHLQKYGYRFNAAEINSSFHRPHKSTTYTRWASSVPEGFRFSVKVPKAITHVAKLKGCDELLRNFSLEVAGLAEKLAVVLIQLPPSLAFHLPTANRFLRSVRALFSVDVALEARHKSWFTESPSQLMQKLHICRVDADPRIAGTDDSVPPSQNIYYLRLHGSPKMYYSDYSEERLSEFSKRLTPFLKRKKEVWCIFDNTAGGRALPNALSMKERFEK